jgi:hypothetical protein
MNFFIYKKLSLECRKYLPADYEFYNGRSYYYDTKANQIKVIAAKTLVGIMMYVFIRKGMGVGNVTWPVEKEDTRARPK